MRAALFAAMLLATPLLPLAEKTAVCDAECDKQAASCVDTCEEQFRNDPAQRVGCKVKCAEKRASCSKSCGVVVELAAELPQGSSLSSQHAWLNTKAHLAPLVGTS